MKSRLALDEHSGRSTTPSLLMATVGQRVLSRLDDGTGCCSPEQVVTVWTEEGISSSREILQVSALHGSRLTDEPWFDQVCECGGLKQTGLKMKYLQTVGFLS